MYKQIFTSKRLTKNDNYICSDNDLNIFDKQVIQNEQVIRTCL